LLLRPSTVPFFETYFCTQLKNTQAYTDEPGLRLGEGGCNSWNLNLCKCPPPPNHFQVKLAKRRQFPWTLNSLLELHFGVYGGWTGQLIVTASRADQSGDFYLCCCGLGAWPESVHGQREVERLENWSGQSFCQAWQRADRTSSAGRRCQWFTLFWRCCTASHQYPPSWTN